MAMHRGPHVRELFIGHQSGFDYDEKESKKSYNISKKTKGPQHPKLGAYKPKILTGDSEGNIPLTRSPGQQRANREPQAKEGLINRAFVIGDKDVPMVLEPSENIYSEIQDPVVPSSDNEQTTSNPIFNESSPVRSPTQHQGNVYRDNYSRSKPVTRASEEINGVPLPPPDYDETEMTMNFESDDIGSGDTTRSMYREFAGEDFAQYLSDDEEDYEFDHPHYTVRSKPPVSRKATLYKDKKSKTEAWRGDKPKRDSSKSLFSKNPKNKGKSTLRKFSVTDTKLGIDMVGNSKDQPKASMRNGVPYESSYESFLQSRNGGPRWGSLESASSDSGHETGDDLVRGGFDKKGPFWKKLTVKIKSVGYGIKN